MHGDLQNMHPTRSRRGKDTVGSFGNNMKAILHSRLHGSAAELSGLSYKVEGSNNRFLLSNIFTVFCSICPQEGQETQLTAALAPLFPVHKTTPSCILLSRLGLNATTRAKQPSTLRSAKNQLSERPAGRAALAPSGGAGACRKIKHKLFGRLFRVNAIPSLAFGDCA